MNLKITIDNYEEIMFRLVENDFDEPTRKYLLEQIEENVLFKFEWEQWQKTYCVDPIENYAVESIALTQKIIQISKPQPFAGRRKMLYLTAAAVAAMFIGILFFNDIFNTGHEQVVETIKAPEHKNITPLQNQNTPADYVQNDHKQIQKPENSDKILLPVEVAITPELANVSVEEIPVLNDSVSLSIAVPEKTHREKPRYSITIETTLIEDGKEQMSEIASNEKVKLTKVFTNTKILFRRKPNGEPDKIILLGEDESYLCINLNQTIK